jgi:hypothetical protein
MSTNAPQSIPKPQAVRRIAMLILDRLDSHGDSHQGIRERYP